MFFCCCFLNTHAALYTECSKGVSGIMIIYSTYMTIIKPILNVQCAFNSLMNLDKCTFLFQFGSKAGPESLHF